MSITSIIMTEYITNAELKEKGRLVINQATRDAGNMKEGDILQLKIEIMKKKSDIR